MNEGVNLGRRIIWVYKPYKPMSYIHKKMQDFWILYVLFLSHKKDNFRQLSWFFNTQFLTTLQLCLPHDCSLSVKET